MLVDFLPETKRTPEILAFGFDSKAADGGLVPLEAKVNDLVCELHDQHNLYVVLRPAGDRYFIVGRAIITHINRPRLLSPPSTPSLPEKLTLYVSTAVVQLLTCPNSVRFINLEQ